MSTSHKVEFLILGAGWTSNFLIPALQSDDIEYAATTTTGHDGTIPFKFDPDSSTKKSFEVLPDAKTILITFPLKGTGQSKKLTELYHTTHPDAKPRWIQLGSTGIFTQDGWSSHKSSYDKSNARAMAEDELLACSTATVLNLAGLYDNDVRVPKKWIPRVAKTKDDVAGKQSLHLIHGKDVARGIVACHKHFDAVQGQRWILTDLFSYDWWSLFMAWGGTLEDGNDVREVVMDLMVSSDIGALPRDHGKMARTLDARDFWKAVGTVPQEGTVL